MMNERAFVNPRIHKSDQIDKILYSSRHLNTWHHAYRALSLYCLSKIVLSSNWHLEAIWGNAYDLHLAYKLNTLIQITHHSYPFVLSTHTNVSRCTRHYHRPAGPGDPQVEGLVILEKISDGSWTEWSLHSQVSKTPIFARWTSLVALSGIYDRS